MFIINHPFISPFNFGFVAHVSLVGLRVPFVLRARSRAFASMCLRSALWSSHLGQHL